MLAEVSVVIALLRSAVTCATVPPVESTAVMPLVIEPGEMLATAAMLVQELDVRELRAGFQQVPADGRFGPTEWMRASSSVTPR